MTPGQTAYEEWRHLHAYPTISWAALSKSAKSVWETVARAVLQQHKTITKAKP